SRAYLTVFYRKCTVCLTALHFCDILYLIVIGDSGYQNAAIAYLCLGMRSYAYAAGACGIAVPAPKI
ncbi:hypothetical protein, partial [Anaerotruncus colihominis]|uniref:hypothetical protein n=1 Tax=Anaerotruncus colihominis TaxID=169435 RepID=UPI00242BC7C9